MKCRSCGHTFKRSEGVEVNYGNLKTLEVLGQLVLDTERDKISKVTEVEETLNE